MNTAEQGLKNVADVFSNFGVFNPFEVSKEQYIAQTLQQLKNSFKVNRRSRRYKRKMKRYQRDRAIRTEVGIFYNDLLQNTIAFDYDTNKYLYDNISAML